MVATESPPRDRRSDDDLRAWLEDVFATIRSAIGDHRSELLGRALHCGAGRFAYDLEGDRVAFTIEIRDDFLGRRRAFAPIDWRTYDATHTGRLLLERYGEMLGTGRAPPG